MPGESSHTPVPARPAQRSRLSPCSSGTAWPWGLVLLDLCDAHADQVSAARPALVPARHCFFDPLHGTRTRTTPWRRLGSRRKVTVWACGDCAAALRNHRQPEALPAVLDGGQRIPYYELPPERSVWAATGYGTLHDDLVAPVLRGDPRDGR